MVPYMVPYGTIWYQMVPNGTIWYHMVPYGTIWYTIWYHMVPYGTIWYRMVSYDTIWYHMVPYGTKWYHMVPTLSSSDAMVGTVWVPIWAPSSCRPRTTLHGGQHVWCIPPMMVPYGTIWYHMVPYGPIWYHHWWNAPHMLPTVQSGPGSTG